MKIISNIIAGISGFWLADKFITGVDFSNDWETLLLAGLTLGLANFFVKPILKIITVPIRFLTFGLFGLLINVGMVWAVDFIFPEFTIQGIIPLLWTTLIIWGLGILLSKLIPNLK